MSILAMNQSVFGSTFETTRRSKVSNAIETELVIPVSAVEMIYEEMEYVEGGGVVSLTLGISCTIGGFVEGGYRFLLQDLTSALTSITFGLGIFLSGIISTLVQNMLGGMISSAVNQLAGPTHGFTISKTYSVSSWLLPNFNMSYIFDIGTAIGGMLGGGIGGGLSGAPAYAPELWERFK